MTALRLGARFIGGVTREGVANDLITAGFARILAEDAFEGWAILSRGEKPGIDIAQTDAAAIPGRYVHLLIQQQPNIPVWKLGPDDTITWQAAMLRGDPPRALAFSSLPKAVEFMQAAVLAGTIRDVNKVGKFRKELAAAWPFDVMMNPSLADVQGADVTFIDVDPTTAEAPDE